jgi:hypothetical protein
MSDEKKEVLKCNCGVEGCNLECDPITFTEDEKEEEGCNEPSCHI